MPLSESVMCRVAPQPHCTLRSIGGKHGEAEAVLEAGVELHAFNLEGSGGWESIQPGRGWAAGTPEKSGPDAFAILGTGGKGGMQGVCTGLGGVLEDRVLHLRDDAHGVWAGLSGLQRPEADGGVVQGLPQRPKLLPAGSVKGPERRRTSSHG
jgi:hypothetical protein